MKETPSYRIGSLLGNNWADLLPPQNCFVVSKTETKYLEREGNDRKVQEDWVLVILR